MEQAPDFTPELGTAILPIEATWETWPFASIGEKYDDYRRDGTYAGLSLVNYLTVDWSWTGKGICHGLCSHWLRCIASSPWQTPMERMASMEKELDSAATTQLLYKELHQRNLDLEPAERLNAFSEEYSSSAKASKLKFFPIAEIVCESGVDALSQVQAQVVKNGLHMVEFRHKAQNGRSTGHVITMLYRPKGSTQFFDPNRGEYSVGFGRFGQFWNDYHREFSGKRSFERIRLYSVEYSPHPVAFGPSGIV